MCSNKYDQQGLCPSGNTGRCAAWTPLLWEFKAQVQAGQAMNGPHDKARRLLWHDERDPC
jgi:hypothetical protein